jgi:hypothetical protein
MFGSPTVMPSPFRKTGILLTFQPLNETETWAISDEFGYGGHGVFLWIG